MYVPNSWSTFDRRRTIYTCMGTRLLVAGNGIVSYGCRLQIHPLSEITSGQRQEGSCNIAVHRKSQPVSALHRKQLLFRCQLHGLKLIHRICAQVLNLRMFLIDSCTKQKNKRMGETSWSHVHMLLFFQSRILFVRLVSFSCWATLQESELWTSKWSWFETICALCSDTSNTDSHLLDECLATQVCTAKWQQLGFPWRQLKQTLTFTRAALFCCRSCPSFNRKQWQLVSTSTDYKASQTVVVIGIIEHYAPKWSGGVNFQQKRVIGTRKINPPRKAMLTKHQFGNCFIMRSGELGVLNKDELSPFWIPKICP